MTGIAAEFSRGTLILLLSAHWRDRGTGEVAEPAVSTIFQFFGREPPWFLIYQYDARYQTPSTILKGRQVDMATITQAQRSLSRSPRRWATDVLLLLGFSGTESISRLFSYQLELASENDSIAAKDIVGKNGHLERQPRSTRNPRYFNGFVSRFVAGAREPSQAADLPRRGRPLALVPHPHHRLPDLPEPERPRTSSRPIFGDFGFSDYELEPQGLVSQAGILRPVPRDGLQLHLPADGARGHLLLLPPRGRQAHAWSWPTRPARYTGLSREPGRSTRRARWRPTTSQSWEHHYEFRSGKWTQTDYNFETPSTSLLTTTSTVIDLPDAHEVRDLRLSRRVRRQGRRRPGDQGADGRRGGGLQRRRRGRASAAPSPPAASSRSRGTTSTPRTATT